MMISSEIDTARHSGMAICSYADGHVSPSATPVLNLATFDLMPTVSAGTVLNTTPWRLENAGTGDYFASEGNPAPCIRESAGNYAFGLSRFLDQTGGPLATDTVKYWWKLEFDIKYYSPDTDAYKRMWQTLMIQKQPPTHSPNATNAPANGTILCRLDAQQWNWGDGNNLLVFGRGNGSPNPPTGSTILSANVANHLTVLYPVLNRWNHVVIMGYKNTYYCTFGGYTTVSRVGDAVNTEDWKTPNAIILYNDESPGSYSYVDNLKFGYK
jgi:prepilin-type processing-associated H-X9-DG protein